MKEIHKKWKITKISSFWPLFLRLRWKPFFSILNAETLRKPTVSGTFCYSGFFPLKQGFHMFTFSEKHNGILMILKPFWALFACDVRTDARTHGGQAGPARPAPRAWHSSRVRASPPPHSNIARASKLIINQKTFWTIVMPHGAYWVQEVSFLASAGHVIQKVNFYGSGRQADRWSKRLS